MKGRRRQAISVNDRMQSGYRYERVAPIGRNFHPEFRPELTPKQMLELGVFCGKYMTDARKEFPTSWFTRAKLSPHSRDCSLNYFGVDASQPLSVWRKKGWIHSDDPRGFRFLGSVFEEAGDYGTADDGGAAVLGLLPGRPCPSRPSAAADRLGEMRDRLKPFYSAIGRPSVDPALKVSLRTSFDLRSPSKKNRSISREASGPCGSV
jgi:hypothetical protein